MPKQTVVPRRLFLQVFITRHPKGGTKLEANIGDMMWDCRVAGDPKLWPEAKAKEFIRTQPEKFSAVGGEMPLVDILKLL